MMPAKIIVVAKEKGQSLVPLCLCFSMNKLPVLMHDRILLNKKHKISA
jgi:hypothetical protein